MSRSRFSFCPQLEALEDRFAPGTLFGEPESPVNLALLAGIHAGQQEAAMRTTSPVVERANPGVVRGESTLLRTDTGISINLTASGLQQGVYTLWWAVINPGATGPIVGYGTGHVVGPHGTATFAAHLNEGEFISGHPVFPGGTLQDARQAEIRVVIRYHGAVDPGQLQQQLKTYQPELGAQNDLLITIHTPPA
jgi:hypothetical protein